MRNRNITYNKHKKLTELIGDLNIGHFTEDTVELVARCISADVILRELHGQFTGAELWKVVREDEREAIKQLKIIKGDKELWVESN